MYNPQDPKLNRAANKCFNGLYCNMSSFELVYQSLLSGTQLLLVRT